MIFKLLSLALLTITSLPLIAASNTMKFSYKNADIRKAIEDYAAKSGQKFIVDSQIRGMITVLNDEPVTIEEAFNDLSTALAINGLAISKREGLMVVMQARAIQRNLIEVVNDVPPLKPERMVTWIAKLKHVEADQINRELRILTSKDGELVPYTETNQLIVTDYTPNIHRIAKMLEQIDIPVDPKRKRTPPLQRTPRTSGKNETSPESPANRKGNRE